MKIYDVLMDEMRSATQHDLDVLARTARAYCEVRAIFKAGRLVTRDELIAIEADRLEAIDALGSE